MTAPLTPERIAELRERYRLRCSEDALVIEDLLDEVERLREENAKLEQRVCEFQASALIDVAALDEEGET